MKRFIFVTFTMFLILPTNALLVESISYLCLKKTLKAAIGSIAEHSSYQEYVTLRSKIYKNPKQEINFENLDHLSPPMIENLKKMQSNTKIVRWFKSWITSNDLYLKRKKSIAFFSKKEFNIIQQKILKNPAVKLNLEDSRYLEIDGFGEDGKWLREISKTHGSTIRLINILKKKSLVLAGIFVTLGIMHKFLLEADEISREEYLERGPLKNDEFDMIFYDVHTSIKLGEDEYDYMTHEMRKNALNDYDNKASLRIRIKLTKKEVDILREFLEEDVGANGLYLLSTLALYSTCISNINRAIENSTSLAIPDGIDRSPVSTIGYFKLKKALGNKHIKSIVSIPATSGKKSGLAIGASILKNYVWDPADSFITGFFFLDSVLAARLDRTESGWSFSRPNAK